ncbi:glycerol-3-phosphate dehydrogenase, mitochondrial [Hyalella azteca]|uniref:Glycerol-3-phosphate dehydrogenase, mitochondrial n=1 Tax=Hyalella azteca TaxID=294128 RepID=A0A8B7PCR1_HYAAZ|nr:glycerol-3-phosphate dehydrogenase, mitochondrial [Hyalella azteca]
MGQNVNRASREKIPINLTKSEISDYVKRFNSLDTDKKGYISLNDLRRSLEVRGQDVPGEKLHEILKEIDLNLNGQVELEEYLQMMAALKSGSISHSRFAQLAQMAEEHATKNVISVERSGGGV